MHFIFPQENSPKVLTGDGKRLGIQDLILSPYYRNAVFAVVRIRHRLRQRLVKIPVTHLAPAQDGQLFQCPLSAKELLEDHRMDDFEQHLLGVFGGGFHRIGICLSQDWDSPQT